MANPLIFSQNEFVYPSFVLLIVSFDAFFLDSPYSFPNSAILFFLVCEHLNNLDSVDFSKTIYTILSCERQYSSILSESLQFCQFALAPDHRNNNYLQSFSFSSGP